MPASTAGGPERGLWVAAERLPQFLALWPEARLDPPIAAPAPHADRHWSEEEALVEILRGRLEGLGPVTETELAAPLGLAPDAIAAGARRVAGRRVRAARAFHAGRRAGRMVRAPAARAHPPLHAEAAARRDRAGRGARLPALPVRLAAGDRRHPHGGAGRARRGARPARRLRGAGRSVGDRDPAGAASPGTIRPGSTTSALPDALPGPGCGRAATPASAAPPVPLPVRAHDADHIARAAARVAMGRAVADTRSGAGERAGRAPSPISSATTAPRSSTSWPTARGCCARRSRRRWPNSWRWGWSARTASPGCARC